jgi:hypothetical protein
MAKAFNVSFTDPQANAKNKPYHEAAKTAMDDIKKNNAAGVSANTPEEKAIQEYNKAVDTGSYGNQFMKQQPQQLAANPQYEAQLKDYLAKQKYVAQYIIPKYIDQQTDMAKTRMQENTKLIEKKAEIMQKYYDTQVSYFGKIDAANIAADKYLRGVAMRNAQMGADTLLRAQTALQLAGLKDNKGNWKGEALKNQAIGSFTTEINRVNADNSKLLADNQALKAKYPDGLPPDQAQVYNNNENTMKMNSLHASQMADERQKYTTGIYGTPVVTPPTATDSVTKGYVQNAAPTGTPTPNSAATASGTGEYPRFNISPGVSVPITLFGRSGTPANGPADDSSAAIANQTDLIDQGTINLQRGFEINNQIDPDDSAGDASFLRGPEEK